MPRDLAAAALEIADDPLSAAAFLVNTRHTPWSDRPTREVAREIGGGEQ